MKIVQTREMQALDQAATARYGIPALSLMEQAGEKLASWVLELLNFPLQARVVVLAGSGKNGGDGLVCARHLAKAGVKVVVLLLPGTSWAPETRRALQRLKKNKVKVRVSQGRFPHAWMDDLAGADLAVDALLGLGLSGAPRPPFSHAIAALNAAEVKVMAADIPSGLDADTGEPTAFTVRADWTMTFGFPKVGLLGPRAADCVGRLRVEPLGFPQALLSERGAEWIYVDGSMASEFLPRRSWIAHKRSAGKVLVVGGSAQYHGAPLLAAQGAIRSGAGYTALAFPKCLEAAVRAHTLEEIIHPLPCTPGGGLGATALVALLRLAAGYDALVVGPGLGREAASLGLVRGLLERVRGPKALVLDADGLRALAGRRTLKPAAGRPALILTPHEGEAAMLLGQTPESVAQDRGASARALAFKYDAVVLLKGHHSVVASPEGSLWVNSSGSPALATAGTGDVLAGSIGAWAAQKLPPKEAAGLGAYVHGVAGDLAACNSRGLGVRARDVAERLPAAIGTL